MRNLTKFIVGIVATLLFVSSYLVFSGELQFLSATVVNEDVFPEHEEVKVGYGLDVSLYNNFQVKFSDKIVEAIDGAKEEVFIAMYNFDILSIKDAIVRASDKGVKVKMYFNCAKKKNLEDLFGPYLEKISVHYVGQDEYYLMHHKFMIVDPGTEDQLLITGSGSWTNIQEGVNINNLLTIRDPEIIESYFEEIDRLDHGLYGNLKLEDDDYNPWDKTVYYPDNESVETWFSPGEEGESIQSRIMDLINLADEKIDIEMTQIASTYILEELLDKAKSGVVIRIIVDINDKELKSSRIPWLESKINNDGVENISIYEGGTKSIDGGVNSIFHRRNIIIDDRIVITGTLNLSEGGFFRNDENILIFNSKDVAKEFEDNFESYLK